MLCDRDGRFDEALPELERRLPSYTPRLIPLAEKIRMEKGKASLLVRAAAGPPVHGAEAIPSDGLTCSVSPKSTPPRRPRAAAAQRFFFADRRVLPLPLAFLPPAAMVRRLAALTERLVVFFRFLARFGAAFFAGFAAATGLGRAAG